MTTTIDSIQHLTQLIMSKGINKTIHIGNLTDDPEVNNVNGSTVCNFSIACNNRYKNRDGEYVDNTVYLDIAAWGKLGEICGEYLAKGKQVYVEGSIRPDKWTDNDGNKRTTWQIRAEEVTFLGGRQMDAMDQREPATEEPDDQRQDETFEPSDDLPF